MVAISGRDMSGEKTCEAKIIDDLNKTGFPTEIVVGSIIASCGYGVIHSPAYTDPIESKSREFDIRAFRNWNVIDETPKWGVATMLVVECKKSDKPWVFFTTPQFYDPLHWIGDPIPLHHNMPSLNKIGAVPEEVVSIDRERLTQIHHYNRLPRIAHTYFEPFKSRDHNSHGQTIHAAVTSCTNAVIFLESEKRPSRYPMFFYPIIVFSGEMFEAVVAPDKAITLTKTQHVQLAYRYMYDATRGSIFEDQQFIIDVVHEAYLPTFLEVIEIEMTAIAESLRTTVMKKWQPFQPTTLLANENQ